MHIASYSYVDGIASLVTSSLAWPDCLFTFSTTNNSDNLANWDYKVTLVIPCLIVCFFTQPITYENITPSCIISRHDAIHLQTTYESGLTKCACIQSKLWLMCIQCAMWINLLPVCIIFIVWTCTPLDVPFTLVELAFFVSEAEFKLWWVCL